MSANADKSKKISLTSELAFSSITTDPQKGFPKDNDTSSASGPRLKQMKIDKFKYSHQTSQSAPLPILRPQDDNVDVGHSSSASILENIVPSIAEQFDVKKINALLESQINNYQRLPIVLGTDNFAEITMEDCVFVDKSMLIKEFIESKVKVSIITRPRRWGKSLNMDMLAKFFAIQHDDQDKELLENPYKELFSRLEIGKNHPDLVAEHQGKYPVIFFCFKYNSSDGFDNAMKSLRKEVKTFYEKYSYLKNSKKLLKSQIKDFRKYLRGDEDIDLVWLGSSILFLSELLHKHHGKEVFIFIDEYDRMLNSSFKSDYYPLIENLIRRLLGATLKGNEHLKQAIVTGITKIAKASVFSGLNNVSEYSILNKRYSQYYGFTEDEVSRLFSQANIVDPTIRSAVKLYYNGYNIGDCVIYNPWSIVNFFKELEISDYWVNTESAIGNHQLTSAGGLLMNESMQESVRALILSFQEGNKRGAKVTINQHVIFKKLQGDPTAMWTILLYAGYLTPINFVGKEGFKLTYEVKIPNREVFDIYKGSINDWFEDVCKLNRDEMKSIGLNLEDLEDYIAVFVLLLKQKKDLVGQMNERFLHSLVEGAYVLYGKDSTHRLSMEKTAGSGRLDSIFYPIAGRSDKVIIHEYKYLPETNSKKIDQAIEDALWQVYEKVYFQEAIDKYIEHSSANNHFKQLEIRGIVTFSDEDTKEDIGIRGEAITHSMEEIVEIAAFFGSLSVKEKSALRKTIKIGQLIEDFRKDIGYFDRQSNIIDTGTAAPSSDLPVLKGKGRGTSTKNSRSVSKEGAVKGCKRSRTEEK